MNPETPYNWKGIWRRAHMSDEGTPNAHGPAVWGRPADDGRSLARGAAAVDAGRRWREASPIMAEAYRIGRMVEEECGLEGYDGEVEQPVRTDDIEVAASRLGGLARWAQETLT
ncbi:hypothetical protein D3105_13640 [Streptomyces globisporus]|uniref:Uncharacterized protein n=2 Tax=Streptomyces globisporus TaxID=1908 RepID=A0A423V0G8_STRGL|nr:hypothetical protein D3105_13640 [Streptomyces globisporus]